MRPIFMISKCDVVLTVSQEPEFLEMLIERNTMEPNQTKVFQKYTVCQPELTMISQSIQDLFQI